jgi:hypothetical protein
MLGFASNNFYPRYMVAFFGWIGLVQLDVALISKIMGLPIVGTQPED